MSYVRLGQPSESFSWRIWRVEGKQLPRCSSLTLWPSYCSPGGWAVLPLLHHAPERSPAALTPGQVCEFSSGPKGPGFFRNPHPQGQSNKNCHGLFLAHPAGIPAWTRGWSRLLLALPPFPSTFPSPPPAFTHTLRSCIRCEDHSFAD